MCRGACRRPGSPKQDAEGCRAIPLTSVTESKSFETEIHLKQICDQLNSLIRNLILYIGDERYVWP
jgi:hypothetical protein